MLFFYPFLTVVTPLCTFRNVAGGIVVVTTWMILRRSSSLQEFVNTFTEAVLPLGNTLRAISEGSLCFIVQAQTISALEALWKAYKDGTLQRNLQEFLITEEIEQLVGSEVKLTVTIDEQEYKFAVLDMAAAKQQGNSSYSPLHIFSLAIYRSQQVLLLSCCLNWGMFEDAPRLLCVKVQFCLKSIVPVIF